MLHLPSYLSAIWVFMCSEVGVGDGKVEFLAKLNAEMVWMPKWKKLEHIDALPQRKVQEIDKLMEGTELTDYAQKSDSTDSRHIRIWT